MSPPKKNKTYIDLKVRVKQGLELKWLVAVVGDDEGGVEAVTV